MIVLLVQRLGRHWRLAPQVPAKPRRLGRLGARAAYQAGYYIGSLLLALRPCSLGLPPRELGAEHLLGLLLPGQVGAEVVETHQVTPRRFSQVQP